MPHSPPCLPPRSSTLPAALALLLLLAACAGPRSPGPADTGSRAAADLPRPQDGLDSRKEDEGTPDLGPLPETRDPREAVEPGPPGAAEIAARVDADRLWEDLLVVAQPRPPGSDHWLAVQQLCQERLSELGFQVELRPFESEGKSGVNVVGLFPGEGREHELVFVSAHYDHIADCDGADDNASGVAGVLETARALVTARYDRTLAVACWDLEEQGLVGSRAYVDELKAKGGKVAVSFVYEMIGYCSHEPGSQEMPPGLNLLFPEEAAKLEANGYRGDFVALVTDSLAHLPATNLALFMEELTEVPPVVIELDQAQKNSALFYTLQRSDHAAFWLNDYPAMMITDTAEYRNENYHCKAGPDSAERLDPAFLAAVVRGTTAAAAHALGPRKKP
jgi:hypothetical protein